MRDTDGIQMMKKVKKFISGRVKSSPLHSLFILAGERELGMKRGILYPDRSCMRELCSAEF